MTTYELAVFGVLMLGLLLWCIHRRTTTPVVLTSSDRAFEQHCLRRIRELEDALHASELKFAHLDFCWEQVLTVVREWDNREDKEDPAEHERYFERMWLTFLDLDEARPSPPDPAYRDEEAGRRLLRRLRRISWYDASRMEYQVSKASVEAIREQADRLALQHVLEGHRC